MRLATICLLLAVVACSDVRDFAGEWRGNRVGDSPVLRVGEGETAALRIDAIDKHGMRGHLTVTGGAGAVLVDAGFTTLEAAEADALSTMTFAGAPTRVYLAFVPVTAAAAGDALAVIALYDSRRVELRLLKGEPQPLYAIFTLSESGG